VIPHLDLEKARLLLETEFGFRRHATFNADNPSVEVMSRHGARIWLVRQQDLDLPDPEFKLLVPRLLPSFEFKKLKADGGSGLHEGRVKEMVYRDLIPGRQGGRFIASHITLAGNSPVIDSVHFHRLRFQMIYGLKGWVRLAYQDQGPEFVMEEGDCVLQPPEIRHQVIASSPAGAEVVEFCCPAAHWTFYEYDLALPNAAEKRPHDFEGQRFIHHRAAEAQWRPWRLPGFESRDLGIKDASGNVAQAHVVRRSGRAQQAHFSHNGEILFMFILKGTLTLQCENQALERFQAGESIVVPGGLQCALIESATDLEFLEVALPGDLEITIDEGPMPETIGIP
jgi:quercetin dioxygenase-like cupin family protein